MINFWKSIPMLIRFFIIFLVFGISICLCGYCVRDWMQSSKGKTVERFEEKIEHTSETLIEIYPPKDSPLGRDRAIHKFVPPENNL